jgi:hypothetical protein
MYTNLPHEDLMAEIVTTVDEALLAYATQTGLSADIEVGFRVAEDAADDDIDTLAIQSDRLYDRLQVKDMLKDLLSNVYFLNGDTLTRQVVGLPMGTNCAPHLANLYCYAKEARYMDQNPHYNPPVHLPLHR